MLDNYLRKPGCGIAALVCALSAGCAGPVATKMKHFEYDTKIKGFHITVNGYVPTEIKYGLKIPEEADKNSDALMSKEELKNYIIDKIK
jgi:hypothetical protein